MGGGGFANPAGEGGIMGGALGPVLGSQKPRQTPQQYSLFDPNVGMGGVPAEIQGLIRGQAFGGGGGGSISAGPNPFVQAGPEQRQAMAAMQQFQEGATPAFGAATRGLEQTIGGQYLDPMARPEFQRLATARQDIARDQFEDLMSDINARAAARGNYGSSAREQQLARQAGRVGTQAAQDIAQAGWGQYGAERGLQEQAIGRGAQLAPGLAGQVFGAGEQLRGAEQQANIAHMNAQIEAQRGTIEASLRARGMDQQGINQYMQLLKMSQFEPIKHITGKSPYEENLAAVNSAASLMGAVKGT